MVAARWSMLAGLTAMRARHTMLNAANGQDERAVKEDATLSQVYTQAASAELGTSGDEDELEEPALSEAGAPLEPHPL